MSRRAYSGFVPKPSKKCWCGSGRKAKNCHGLASSPPQQASFDQPRPNPVPNPAVQLPPVGIPGEEQFITIIPIVDGRTPLTPADIGKPGTYKVQFLLSRPGNKIGSEREYKFIDNIIGDSHLCIAKPKAERGPSDAVSLRIEVHRNAATIVYTGLPNAQGFLGKITTDTIPARDFQDAENTAYEGIAPCLSAWSLHLDIPVNIESTQISEIATHAATLRVRAPSLGMNGPQGGVSPLYSEESEFGHYASLYREALNSNSAFYRFLCFFKIIESILSRRARIDGNRKRAGERVTRVPARVPQTTEELVRLLKTLYPWRSSWDEMALRQLLPSEAQGKKIGYVKDQLFNPLRLGIAHALLKTGEVRVTLDKGSHIQLVNKWLPLARLLARATICGEFPEYFGLVVPNASGS